VTLLHGVEAPLRDNDLYVSAACHLGPLGGHRDAGASQDLADRLALSDLMDDQYWAQFPDPLSIQAIATILRLSETTALRRLQDRTIPGHFIGGSWIVFQLEFRAWLNTVRNVPVDDDLPDDLLADYDEELGMSELMEFFGKTKQTIRRWLVEKHIPGYLINGRWVSYKTELRAALAASLNQGKQG
jgi:hypothetical protein